MEEEGEERVVVPGGCYKQLGEYYSWILPSGWEGQVGLPLLTVSWIGSVGEPACCILYKRR